MESDLPPLYTPLHSATSTRLLKLLPGSGRGPIHAELFEVDLADDPEFEAVSYTWGDDFIVKHVILNEHHEIKVRNNLWTFLGRLRHETQPRVLWVDALCISQTDLKEKSQQVGIIGKIFGYATTVLSWVGDHTESSEELFRPWPNMPSHFDRVGGRMKVNEARKRRNQKEKTRRTTIWQHFLQRPYFHRTWIVQEIGIATKILVHCGNDTMGWEDLISRRWNRAYMDNSRFVFDGIWSHEAKDFPFSQLWSLDNLRDPNGLRRPSNEDIFELVHRFHEMECMVRHDKVYALLSLERWRQGDAKIIADYTLNVPEMVIQVFTQRITWDYDPAMVSQFLRNLALEEEESRLLSSLLKNKPHEDGAHRNWDVLYNAVGGVEETIPPSVSNDQGTVFPSGSNVRSTVSPSISSDSDSENFSSSSDDDALEDWSSYRGSDEDDRYHAPVKIPKNRNTESQINRLRTRLISRRRPRRVVWDDRDRRARQYDTRLGLR